MDRSPANALINKGVKRKKAGWWNVWEERKKGTRYSETKPREMRNDCSCKNKKRKEKKRKVCDVGIRCWVEQSGHQPQAALLACHLANCAPTAI